MLCSMLGFPYNILESCFCARLKALLFWGAYLLDAWLPSPIGNYRSSNFSYPSQIKPNTKWSASKCFFPKWAESKMNLFDTILTPLHIYPANYMLQFSSFLHLCYLQQISSAVYPAQSLTLVRCLFFFIVDFILTTLSNLMSSVSTTTACYQTRLPAHSEIMSNSKNIPYSSLQSENEQLLLSFVPSLFTIYLAITALFCLFHDCSVS